MVSKLLLRHLLLVGVLVFIVGLITTSDALHGLIASLIAWTEGLIDEAPVAGMLMFVLLSMLSAMVAFFSSSVLVPVAIVAWGTTAAVLLLWLGWFLGGIVSFSIGRFLGRGVVAMIIGEDRIGEWQRQLAERTRFIHVLAFQAVVPSEIPGYLLGLLRYRFLWYAAALAITEVPYALAVVLLGESFLERRAIVFVLVGLAIVAAGFIGLRAIGNRTSIRPKT